MIYRVIKRLATGKSLSTFIHEGSNIRGDRFKAHVVEALLGAGVLSPVSAPPLTVLPGWKLRGKRFEEAGYDAIAILESTDEDLAAGTATEKFQGYHVRSIRKWRKELESFLLLDQVKITEGCIKC